MTAPMPAARRQDQHFLDVVVAALIRRLREVAASSAVPLRDALGSPEELAARITAVVPEPSRLAEMVGPVYRQASLAAASGRSRQAVADMVRRRRLLALTTSDGHVVVPAFQLGDDLRPLPGIPEVLAVLTPDVVDEWTLASWLTAPQPRLEGRSVVGHLAGGGDVATALVLAESVRRRWAA